MKNNLRHTSKNQKPVSKTKLDLEINTLDLEDQLSLVLRAPWEERFDLITASERAGELVASMPVEELFWTIKATGVEDSGVILNLSTPEQLQFIFDLDWWKKAELVPEKIAAWLLVMFELSEQALDLWLKWILDKDPWLFPALLHKFITVVKRPDEMDIQEAKDLLPGFTLDNIYYLSFKKQKLAPLFANLITRILGISPGYYRDIFETMLWDTPSANLETAYRLRCGRIGDFGVPDYYESLDIYVPLETGQMHRIDLDNPPFKNLPVLLEMPPFVPTLYATGYPALEEGFLALAGQPTMERIVRETTGVANKILMADLTDLDDPEELRFALKKAFSMLNLGVEFLSQELGQAPPEILSTHYMEEITRLSSRLLMPAGAEARRILAQKVYQILPHHLKPVIEAAALRPAALYHKENIRPVSTLADLERLEHSLAEAMAWERITTLMNPPADQWATITDWNNTNFLSPEEFAADSAIATCVANLLLSTRFEIAPLEVEAIKELWKKLKEMGIKELPPLLSQLLEPLFQPPEPGEQRSPLLDMNLAKETVLHTLEEIFGELVALDEMALDEPNFIKGILVKTTT